MEILGKQSAAVLYNSSRCGTLYSELIKFHRQPQQILLVSSTYDIYFRQQNLWDFRNYIYIYIYIYIYRVSQEECARLRENVPYVKLRRYNPKHLNPKLNGYGDNR
jgi:hypothetical protein